MDEDGNPQKCDKETGECRPVCDDKQKESCAKEKNAKGIPKVCNPKTGKCVNPKNKCTKQKKKECKDKTLACNPLDGECTNLCTSEKEEECKKEKKRCDPVSGQCKKINGAMLSKYRRQDNYASKVKKYRIETGEEVTEEEDWNSNCSQAKVDECINEYDPKTSFQCINGECVGTFVVGFYQFLDTGEKILVSGLQKGKGKQQFIQSIDFYNISNLLQANTILERHKNDLKVMMTIDEHNFFKLQQGTFVLESVLKRDFRDQAVDLGFYKSPETKVTSMNLCERFANEELPIETIQKNIRLILKEIRKDEEIKKADEELDIYQFGEDSSRMVKTLKNMSNLIDEKFFDSSFKKYGNLKICWNYTCMRQRGHGDGTAAIAVGSEEIIMNDRIFRDLKFTKGYGYRFRGLCANGVACFTPLECVFNVLAHEMIHALMQLSDQYVPCGNNMSDNSYGNWEMGHPSRVTDEGCNQYGQWGNNGHNKTFMSIGYRRFRFTRYTHNLNVEGEYTGLTMKEVRTGGFYLMHKKDPVQVLYKHANNVRVYGYQNNSIVDFKISYYHLHEDKDAEKLFKKKKKTVEDIPKEEFLQDHVNKEQNVVFPYLMMVPLPRLQNLLNEVGDDMQNFIKVYKDIVQEYSTSKRIVFSDDAAVTTFHNFWTIALEMFGMYNSFDEVKIEGKLVNSFMNAFLQGLAGKDILGQNNALLQQRNLRLSMFRLDTSIFGSNSFAYRFFREELYKLLPYINELSILSDFLSRSEMNKIYEIIAGRTFVLTIYQGGMSNEDFSEMQFENTNPATNTNITITFISKSDERHPQYKEDDDTETVVGIPSPVISPVGSRKKSPSPSPKPSPKKSPSPSPKPSPKKSPSPSPKPSPKKSPKKPSPKKSPKKPSPKKSPKKPKLPSKTPVAQIFGFWNLSNLQQYMVPENQLGKEGKDGVAYLIKKETHRNDMYGDIVLKKFKPTKANSTIEKEAKIQKVAASTGYSPKVLYYSGNDKIIAMEKLEKRLIDVYKKDDTLSEKHQNQLIKIMEALDDVEVLHNDGNSLNLMLDKDDNVKIIDFGLSKTFDKKLKKKWGPHPNGRLTLSMFQRSLRHRNIGIGPIVTTYITSLKTN